MTAPDRMPEAFENSLHDAGHPHMEPPANPGRFTARSYCGLGNLHLWIRACLTSAGFPARQGCSF
jgi:hypothetical protein